MRFSTSSISPSGRTVASSSNGCSRIPRPLNCCSVSRVKLVSYFCRGAALGRCIHRVAFHSPISTSRTTGRSARPYGTCFPSMSTDTTVKQATRSTGTRPYKSVSSRTAMSARGSASSRPASAIPVEETHMTTPPEKMTPYDEFNLEVPENAFPQQGMSAKAAAALVISDEWTDANPMLNMLSFVTTWAEPEAAEVAKRNIFKNYIDHDMYPQVFATETRMVKWLHQLWNGPAGVEPYGTATIGSSEACMLAGLAHKWNWRQKREREGKDATRPNMVTGGNVQIVWKKFLRY